MLLANAIIAHERLRNADAARVGLDEAQALLVLNKELNAKASRFHELVERGNLLRKYGVPLSDIPNSSSTKQAIINVEARFQESPTASTLKQGTRWTSLVAKLDTIINALESQQRHDWKEYFGARLFAGVTPELRKSTLVPTLNKNAIEQYTRLYEKFIRYRNLIPSNAEILEEVHRCSDELGKIQFVDNENVPAAVKRFFDAVATSSGASLELLTTEVIDWLHENELLGNYFARARI
jgi:hypothetical protein